MNHTIEYAVVGGYLLFLLAVGYAFRKFNSNVSDYFRNGGRGTWWLVGASAFMAGISAYTFTGASGVAFEAGWSVAIIYIGNALGFFLNFLFLAPWFRQLRAITGPEVIRMRFGTGTQQFYALFGVLTTLLGSGLTLWAVAIFSSSVFGYPVEAVIVVLGLVVLFYSLTGGSWAVMATDFLQGMVMFPLTVLITILCLNAVGGIGGFFHAITEQNLAADFAFINEPGRFAGESFTLLWAVAMISKQVWAQNTINSAVRYFAVKDGAAARKAAALAFVMMAIGSAFWFIPPMTARILFEDQTLATSLNKPAESAYAIVSMNLLPNGLVGLMVVAMFAATMSSLDTGLNRNAAIFVRDIYPTLCHLFGWRVAKDRAQLLLGRIFTAVFGGLIIGAALYFAQASGQGMFETMLNIGAMLGIPLSVPLLLGLFVRRVPWWSAIFSIACGFTASLTAALWPETWTFQTKVITNLAVGCTAFLGTGLFWRSAQPAYREKVNGFFTRMHTPVDFEKEVGQANDLSQLKLVGGFMVAVGIFIMLLMLLPNDWAGRLGILFVAGFVLAVGTLMSLIGWLRKAPQEAPQDQPQPPGELAAEPAGAQSSA